MIFANNSMLMFRSRNQSPPDNQIWYYAPEKVTLYSETGVTSHTFSDGKGIITFSSAVKTVPAVLRGVTTITEVKLPATVTSIDNNAFNGCTNLKDIYVPWAEGDIAGAPWGAANATVHYMGSDSGGGAISFPDSFSVTSCSGNGAATGAYTKTAETTTVNGKDYPVYSMTQEQLGTTFYIYVCGYQMGSAGVFWALKADSYSATDDSYGALGSCAAGTDGLPQSTSWSSASSDATVSW